MDLHHLAQDAEVRLLLAVAPLVGAVPAETALPCPVSLGLVTPEAALVY